MRSVIAVLSSAVQLTESRTHSEMSHSDILSLPSGDIHNLPEAVQNMKLQ